MLWAKIKTNVSSRENILSKYTSFFPPFSPTPLLTYIFTYFTDIVQVGWLQTTNYILGGIQNSLFYYWYQWLSSRLSLVYLVDSDNDTAQTQTITIMMAVESWGITLDLVCNIEFDCK